MATDDDLEFIRRRFTIPEQLDDQLEQLAKNHYQGNVSLCLRQAVKDHQGTLNGKSRVTLTRLQQHVKQVQNALTDLIESVEAIASETRALREQQSTEQLNAPSTQPTQTTRQVWDALQAADGPLRAEDLIERVELRPVEVRRALGRLVDRGHVMQTPGSSQRYQLVRMTSSANREHTRE